MAIRYTNTRMGYSPDAGRFSNNAFTGRQQSRFPTNARSMNSALKGSRPIVVYELGGKGRWALYHGYSWRRLESYNDAGGVTRWKMSGGFVNNPIAWSSS